MSLQFSCIRGVSDTTVRSEPYYTSTINFTKERSVSLQFGCIRSVSDTTVRSEPYYTSTINNRKEEKCVSTIWLYQKRV